MPRCVLWTKFMPCHSKLHADIIIYHCLQTPMNLSFKITVDTHWLGVWNWRIALDGLATVYMWGGNLAPVRSLVLMFSTYISVIGTPGMMSFCNVVRSGSNKLGCSYNCNAYVTVTYVGLDHRWLPRLPFCITHKTSKSNSKIRTNIGVVC